MPRSPECLAKASGHEPWLHSRPGLVREPALTAQSLPTGAAGENAILQPMAQPAPDGDGITPLQSNLQYLLTSFRGHGDPVFCNTIEVGLDCGVKPGV